MGSATSLLYSMKNPNYVKGLVIIRPPTCWKVKEERTRYKLLKASRILEKKNKLLLTDEDGRKGNFHKDSHLVLQGAAYSNLPEIPDEDSLTSSYQKVTCPILLLTIAGDDKHPVETAEKLYKVLGRRTSIGSSVTLLVSENKKVAKADWGKVDERWMREKNLI